MKQFAPGRISSDRNQASIVLAQVNLEVRQGDFVTILGQSGGGKSTLLKLLGGFIQPSAGQVLFHGALLKGITPQIGMLTSCTSTEIHPTPALPLQRGGSFPPLQGGIKGGKVGF